MVHHAQTHIGSPPPPPRFMPGQQQQQQQQQQQPHHQNQQQQQQQQQPPPPPPPPPPHQHSYRHLSFNANANARSSFSTPPVSGFVPRSAIPLRLSRPAASLPLHTPPNARLAPPHLAEHGEHRLRRKTPNGTIDAGYDGNPTHLASGPPPYKHMIMPTSSKPVPFVPPLRNVSRSSMYPIASSGDRWAYSPSLSFHPLDPPCLLPSDPSMMPSGNTQHVNSHEFAAVLALDSAPSGPVAAHQPYNNVPRVPTALQPMYQQSPGPALFHNGGVLPAAVWPEANLTGYPHGFNPRASSYQNQYNSRALHRPGSDGFVAPFSAMNLRPGYESHPSSIQVPSQKLESLTLDSAAYKNSETRAHGAPSPVRFREKVLTHAHRSYLELLAYLHQTKKSPYRPLGPRTTSRMMIFPKLPKSSGYSSSVFASQHSQNELDDPSSRVGSLSTGSKAELHATSHVQSINHYPLRGIKAQDPASFHVLGTNSSRTPASNHLARDRVPVTPLTSAKAAIEMLTNLCEQSDWKWIDGMLLGGCLHYGLERYEQSLEWFQRIISLDSGYGFSFHSHVLIY